MIFGIKRAVRNWLIITFYLMGFARLQYAYLRHSHGGLYRIICFHSIESLVCSAFERKIVWLKKRYEIVTLTEIIERQEQRSLSGNEIAITFDDGFADFNDVVLPLLKKHEVPVTLFIPSAILELDNVASLKFAKHRIGIEKRLLSRSQLVDLVQSGLVDLQSHSRTHCDFGTETVDILVGELEHSRLKIEEITGRSVNMLAFPFGDIKNMSSGGFEALQQTGYRAAMSIVPGFNHYDSNRFKLNRDSLHPGMSDLLFRAWLSGGYDILKQTVNWIKISVNRISA